jgi:hypothetical protein
MLEEMNKKRRKFGNRRRECEHEEGKTKKRNAG